MLAWLINSFWMVRRSAGVVQPRPAFRMKHLLDSLDDTVDP
jgi:hypothetical protein